MEEHKLIAHQSIGDTFSGIYYVENVFIKKTKTNKDYTDMTLRDKSGSRFVKYWGVINGLKRGDFAFISASVDDYMGNPSLIAKNAEPSDPPSDLSNYIPVYADTDEHAEMFDQIRAKLKELEDKTGDKTAGKIVDEVYGNSTFFQKFITAPGSSAPHYGCQGGLLANTVRVAEQCIKANESYGLTDEEKVVLIASSLLFRIGAIDSYEFQDCMPIETKRGILLGTANLTMTRVSSALKRVVTEFAKTKLQPNQEIVMRILHAISSYDCVSLRPMTKEALILSSIYRMDGDMVDAIQFIQNDTNATEEFTAYDPILRRRYYTGCKQPTA